MSVAVCGGDVRGWARSGRIKGPTCGLAPDFIQANLVVVPEAFANDFQRFCELNPKPCPILDRTAPGEWEPRHVAPGSDLRTDVPMYRVFRSGRLQEEVLDVKHLWRADFVAFLLGCSFTFESVMRRAGLPVRHLEQQCNVPMFVTQIPCVAAGPFHGPLVVTMRPLRPSQAIEAIILTSRYPQAHGAPVHFGDPAEIGIADLTRPDFGDAVSIRAGEVPVFWACGVTPQLAFMQARPEVAITHSPGCMFVTDLVI